MWYDLEDHTSDIVSALGGKFSAFCMCMPDSHFWSHYTDILLSERLCNQESTYFAFHSKQNLGWLKTVMRNIYKWIVDSCSMHCHLLHHRCNCNEASSLYSSDKNSNLFVLPGDNWSVPRAIQQRLPAGVQRPRQSQGERRHDHLLSQQWAFEQLTLTTRLQLHWSEQRWNSECNISQAHFFFPCCQSGV